MDAAPGADDVPGSTAGAAGPSEPSPGPADTSAAPIEPGSLGAHPERHPDDLPPPERDRPGVPSGVLWALALAVVVLTIASWVAFSTESASTDDPNVEKLDPNVTYAPSGLNAPDVSGRPVSTATYATFGGATTDLGAYRGTPMVVNFWAHDCPPCIREMPALERVHQDAGGTVAFVGLAVQDREDEARRLADQTGVSYDLGFDASGQLITDLGGINLPTTVFVDADGTIVDAHAGEISEAELRDEIRTKLGVEVPAGS